LDYVPDVATVAQPRKAAAAAAAGPGTEYWLP